MTVTLVVRRIRAAVGWWIETSTPAPMEEWPARATWCGTVRTEWRPTRRSAAKLVVRRGRT